ncbi:hypothetical protein [Paenirhodobacter populi]|uniref:hypothetical protein n=1 Tax=Paenirhodobacter populi TaxID=2306993 RepID=UPI0019D45E54|nr:hypothetical protein [Sinirhodobacter populi]
MTLKSLLLSAALTCSGITASAEVIEFPDDEFWLGLSKSLYGGQPDFENLAKRTPAYREADDHGDEYRADHLALHGVHAVSGFRLATAIAARRHHRQGRHCRRRRGGARGGGSAGAGGGGPARGDGGFGPSA